MSYVYICIIVLCSDISVLSEVGQYVGCAMSVLGQNVGCVFFQLPSAVLCDVGVGW